MSRQSEANRREALTRPYLGRIHGPRTRSALRVAGGFHGPASQSPQQPDFYPL